MIIERRSIIIIIMFFLLMFFNDIAVTADELSPYGICAHISRHSDHGIARQECKLMVDAGIGWVRTDFDWTTVEPSEGVWDFSYIDETVDIAEASGVSVLPILCYDVAWARPAYKNMDKWLEYVRRTVGRYKDRLRYWEVWNEENLDGFWQDKSRPEDYVDLLKSTYAEIKRIDPELTVLVGGFAGIPTDYIEGVYKAGGGKYFDIMVVHPYRYPNSPEQERLYEDLVALRELMARYGDEDKPIWSTEIGWPTQKDKSFVLEQVIRAGLKTLGIQNRAIRLAVLEEPGYLARVALGDEQMGGAFGEEVSISRLTIEKLKQIDAGSYDVLLLCAEEGIPDGIFDSVERFVRDGGVVIFPEGVPLYYKTVKDGSGKWTHQSLDKSYRKRLRIGWEAWWTKDGVPEKLTKLVVPESFESVIKVNKDFPEASRFLNNSMVQDGDTYTSLLNAVSDSYVGDVAAVIDYNGELKGAAIISTFFNGYRGVSETVQSEILPRAYLLSMLAGVEKTFWYNLRAGEGNPYYNEDNFGIVHSDLSAKPAYLAMAALSRAYPAGSKLFVGKWREGDIYYPSWEQPGGPKVYGIWTNSNSIEIELELKGDFEAFDYLGRPVSVSLKDGRGKILVSQQILYLVVPDSVTFKSLLLK